LSTPIEMRRTPFGPHSVTVGVAIGHRREHRSEESLLDAGLVAQRAPQRFVDLANKATVLAILRARVCFCRSNSTVDDREGRTLSLFDMRTKHKVHVPAYVSVITLQPQKL